MTALSESVQPIARMLMSLLFVISGLGKLGHVEGFSQYLASGGIPAALAWPAVLFEILVGLAFLVGWQTRIAGWLLAAFCIVTAVLYHFDPSNDMQMAMFLKNLGLAGGFAMFALHGAGKWSLDARTGAAQAA